MLPGRIHYHHKPRSLRLLSCQGHPVCDRVHAEFWERYVRWLESGGRLEEADHALARGVGVFCKAHPEMHLFAARYDERRGRVQEARERYDHVLDKLAPTLLQAVVASANFERRQVRGGVSVLGAGCSQGVWDASRGHAMGQVCVCGADWWGHSQRVWAWASV